MKSILASFLFLNISLVANSSLAADYQCFFTDQSRSQPILFGEINLKTVDSNAAILEYESTQGRVSKKITLGQPLVLGKSERCVEYKNEGLCLLGPHDPYEMCRTQCANWGNSNSSVVISGVDNSAYLDLEILEKVDYVKSSYIVFSSNQNYDNHYLGKCVHQNVISLLEAFSTTPVVLKTGSEYNLVYPGIGTRPYASSGDASVTMVGVNEGKSQVTTIKAIADSVLAGKTLPIYPSKDGKSFDLKNLNSATCVSFDYRVLPVRSTLTVKDKEVLNTPVGEATKSLGQLVEINGKTLLAVAQASIISAYQVSDQNFLLSGMLCSAQK